jgi:hypothetical protein
VIGPLHDDVPEQVMSQVEAVQVTVPVHAAIPLHATEHDEPAHVTFAQELAPSQATAHALAALQSTATLLGVATVTEHGMPAGHFGHPPAVQATTQVPPTHEPAPGQRAAQRAAAVGSPPSAAPGPDSTAAASSSKPASSGTPELMVASAPSAASVSTEPPASPSAAAASGL